MKKILLVALAAAAMVGCSQNEEIDNAAQKAEIKIGTVVKASTKAAVTNNDSFDAFTVNAYIVDEADITTSGVGEAYIPGVDYTGGKGVWETTSADKYYWPLEEMHFFAYPTGLKAKYSATGAGYPSLEFTVAATSAEQIDLVVAHEKTIATPSNGKLTLNFKHLLTRINFSYKPEDVTYTYTVTGITINGISGGTVTYKFDNTNGTWGSLTGSTPVNYDYPITVGGIDNDFYPLGDEKASLMLFPQDVSGKTISVTYSTEKNGHSFFNSTKTVTLPASSTWAMGQNIRYKLTLPAGAEEITFETEIIEPTEDPKPGTAE